MSGAQIQASAMDTRTAIWASTLEENHSERAQKISRMFGGSQHQLSIKIRPLLDVLNLGSRLAGLAAQCEIAQYLFEVESQRGVSHASCLVFIGYRASIAEIPLLWGGVSHLHFACSPSGSGSEKGEGVSHPIGHVETPKTP